MTADTVCVERRDLWWLMEGWSRLPVHWCCAFRQAWAASSPAPFLSARWWSTRRVWSSLRRATHLRRGRPPRRQIAGSWLAHAELNAIASDRCRVARELPRDGRCTRPSSPARCALGPSPWPSAGASPWDMLCRDPISSGLRVLTDTDLGRRRQWQVHMLRWAVLDLRRVAPCCVHRRGASDEPHRRALPRATMVAADRHRGRRPGQESSRGEAVEHVVATVWAAIA